MAQTRMRKAFRYQDDSDDNEPLAMDEQEQEELIAKLTRENEDQNDLFLRFLMVIPAISWLVFLLGFVRARYATARLMSLLSITSLWATLYNLVLVPTAPKDGREPPRFTELKARFNIREPQILSPAQQYIPILNGVLSLLIGLWGLTTRDGRGVMDGFWIICWVPVVEYVMIQLARKWIIEVNPGELEKLRYEFRGA